MARKPSANRWWLYQYEAAARLRVHPQTLRNMIRRGDLATVKVGSRNVIRIADVEAIEAGRRAS